ncbi:MAG: PadR family transcriptional regulator [Bacteroidetes bacterium]|jgi:PadR family transcriptional regulator PadR|nr:PadR family transcriptional regulator [Bacteroidota bacterium]MBT5528757.1 PadR family transcriptional regulator [Cytophagia bacterium]MBT3422105.1 PadR family transcriptional regulator [Bacteroidota bacterium]MBT3800823.1 PadR family transcriptional regulator [Bacteroidota bacterium]MBT3935914.1 PadR family transcriptional regulator [Bacteroidota bacterium]
MNIENSKAQMRKGVLEFCTLSVLKKQDSYASDIIGELKEAKLIVVEGTLYPLLTRLKNTGFLSYRWEESTQGPPRKYYQLTEQGEKFLEELKLAWKELNKSIELINKK